MPIGGKRQGDVRTILQDAGHLCDSAALLLHGFGIPIPGFLATPIDYLANAFIGTALDHARRPARQHEVVVQQADDDRTCCSRAAYGF